MVDFNNKTYVIYAHIVPNGKVYVGKTSIKAEHRWANGNGYEYNKDFYKDIKFFGWDNIKHILLEEVIGEESASEAEKKYIEKYKSFDPLHGYNKTTGGDKKYSVREETKMIQKESKEKYYENPEAIEIARIRQREVMKRHGVREKISDSLKNYFSTEDEEHKNRRAKKTAEGIKKYYAENEEARKARSERSKGMWQKEGHKEKVVSKLTGIKRSEAHKKRLSELKSKPVLCVETGVVYKSFQDAADFAGVTKSCINDVLHGRQKKSGGYHWKYAEGYHG